MIGNFVSWEHVLDRPFHQLLISLKHLFTTAFFMTHLHITFKLLDSDALWLNLLGLPIMISNRESLCVSWRMDLRSNSIKGRAFGHYRWKDTIGFCQWDFMRPLVNSTWQNVCV